jgi:hypothetical protein
MRGLQRRRTETAAADGVTIVIWLAALAGMLCGTALRWAFGRTTCLGWTGGRRPRCGDGQWPDGETVVMVKMSRQKTQRL